MIQTQISLTPEQHKKLKLLAVENNSSMAEQIRRAVDKHITGGEHENIKRRSKTNL